VLAAGLLLAGCATSVAGTASPGADLLAAGSTVTPPTTTAAADDGTVVSPPAETTEADPTDDTPTTPADTPDADPTESDPTDADPDTSAGNIPDVDPDEWYPTEANQDPSLAITGIFLEDPKNYGTSYQHVTDPERVAYQHFPPMGGSHDGYWAACNGVVYPVPVRNENMVHALEHGAVWIAYNPETLGADDVQALSDLIQGQNYLMVSPYPGLKSPVSLQSWGHQLELNSPWDERLYEFVYALRQNPYLTPEVNATCDQPTFDVEDPPAFDPSEPGPDAFPLGDALSNSTSTEEAPPTS